MGIVGFIGSVITFPFRLIFRKKENVPESYPDTFQQTEEFAKRAYPPAGNPTEVGLENVRAKIDLMVTQMENLKIEYEALNQRIQNIERMVREIYAMAKS